MNPDPQELKEIKVTNFFVLTLFITLETSSASGSKTVHCSANFNQFAGGKFASSKYLAMNQGQDELIYEIKQFIIL